MKKRQQKKATKLVKSTLTWLDVESVEENEVLLKKGKIVRGVKIKAHAIFLDDESTQVRHVYSLRNVFNKFRHELYHAYVYSPVNVDDILYQLSSQMEFEDNPQIRSMLEDDMEKAILFQQYYKEIEYFIMIQGDIKKIDDFNKKFNEFCFELENAGRAFTVLNKLDYENYFAYLLENQIINDFFYSRGVFDFNMEGGKA